MIRLPFKKIDAFAEGAAGGNPAGCVYLERHDQLTSGQMQVIASQMKGYVSEVAFLSREQGISLQYWSSERKVAFCGHATVAILYDCIKENPDWMRMKELPFQVGSQKLTVYNEIPSQDAVFITAPEPQYREGTYSPSELAPALGASSEAILKELPAEVVHAGLESLIIPMRDLKATLELKPDMEVLKSYCQGHEIDILVVYTPETARSGNGFRTRVFAPTFGYLEDPATGSGNSALGYYLLKHGLWDGSPLILEQNGSFDNPNTVKLMTRDENGYKRVLFGGSALTRIEGAYLLHD